MSMFTRMHDRLSKTSTDPRDKAQAAAREQMGVEYVDLSIQFIGAAGLPKTDVVGSCDPYFVANLDDRIKFVCVV
jgi:hypothetical protein